MTRIAKLPTSTYRVQLRAGVDFDTAASLLPYLQRLGIDWIYLSPAWVASPGSEHGYDVVDPGRFDPCLGGDTGFGRLCEAVRSHGMGILLDIVPNHMSARIDNAWWRDVLEHGRASVYAEFFDIGWDDHPESRVVLPLLGRHYAAVLEAGELTLGRDPTGLVLCYHEHTIPIDPRTWPRVFERVDGDVGPWQSLSRLCRTLPPRHPEPETRKERARLATAARQALMTALEDPSCVAALDATLSSLSATKEPALLHRLLEEQAYRLCYWRSGLAEINYRRFFDIAELAALQTDRQDVFDRTHRLLAQQIDRGCVSGVRVDHVDGMANPHRYLERLRALGCEFVVVEKILGHGERLSEDWPVEGTTGYEFGAAISAVLTDPEGARVLDEQARQRHQIDFEQMAVQAKETVLDEVFAPNVRRLAEALRQLVVHDFVARDVSLAELELAVATLLSHFSVYRTYITPEHVSTADRAVLERAAADARAAVDRDVHLAIDFVARVMLDDVELPEVARGSRANLVRRFQQLSGPVAAKGFEDTALYRWMALPGLCEVGSHPIVPTGGRRAFVEFLEERRRQQPGGLSTTSSHDTKRSEDARCRLLALSQFVQPWLECSRLAHAAFGAEGAESKDEIDLLLQSWLAIVPPEGPCDEDVGQRLEAYVIKAARESKRSTSWIRVNPEREGLIRSRVQRLMTTHDEPWRVCLEALRRPVAVAGAIDALAQTVLKVGSPGIADVYRGTETWDLSLVDPDNRRPVDFERASSLLAELDAEEDIPKLLAQLRRTWSDGRIKTWVLSRGLRARQRHEALLQGGEVEPVEVRGALRDRVVAFARRHRNEWALVVAPRLMGSAGIDPDDPWPVGPAVWQDTRLRVPSDSGDRVRVWEDVLTSAKHRAHDDQLDLGEVLRDLPVALLIGG